MGYQTLRLLSYLHQVLLHVVGHEFNDLFLAPKLLRERVGWESKVFVVGQAVVNSPVEDEVGEKERNEKINNKK